MKESGKIIFGVIMFLISIFRIANSCSKTNEIKQFDSPTYDSNYNSTYNEQVSEIISNINTKKIESNFLYSTYDTLNSYDTEKLNQFKTIKIKKDTSIFIDLQTKIKVKKDTYFQKINGDSLMYVFKKKNNTLQLFHLFQSKNAEIDNLRSIKSSNKISNIHSEKIVPQLNMITYNVLQNDIKFNGCALSFNDQNEQFLIEFESKDKSKAQLKLEALEFLQNDLLENKS